MAKFERSRKDSPRRDRDDRPRGGRRDSGRDSSFEDYSKGRSRSSSRDRDDRPRRDSGRGRGSFGGRPGGRGRRDSGRGRGDVEMTEVICSLCGEKCKVPFKPTSNKPVYCSDCFEQKEKGSKAATSNDIEEIKNKLDKVLALLKKKS